ncbi:hypothetical protein ASPZODRAFT_137151 [Penicilliopsis zonata CBS 506.65]|uniref:Superoxide dismutase n=1 Tax=Penicilliopsis zonata CBS 506.65 TaxID=1073090 RepID=A0A1L9S6I9_9EURO|nr:hypothetical protein ASPZODRAFT_137151 [Penicilliopsis zonata CBS 506.65]OJJ42755.1 hypothetical protein ASPZODRAFT_137151 [Penicilliopsis zonata CBS 506.65]
MHLHHTKHHQAYIDNLNAALSLQEKALRSNDIASLISLQQQIKFHGGGHINHSLFWKNLAPVDTPETDPSSAAKNLYTAILTHWGSFKSFVAAFSATLLSIQGSGWGWLVVKDGGLGIVTTQDQDAVLSGTALIGVDMWEHAYYLQYQNNKRGYVDGIWRVINWKVAEERYLSSKL